MKKRIAAPDRSLFCSDKIEFSMNALLTQSSELRLLAASLFVSPHRLLDDSSTRGTLALGNADGSMGPDAIILALHGRANTITPTLTKILEIRPPSHWGLNEWHDDPNCALRVPNPFGSQDSVRMVAPSEAPKSIGPTIPPLLRSRSLASVAN